MILTPFFSPPRSAQPGRSKPQEARASKKSKKPVRDNRHRYLSFTERLAEVKVDVLKRTGLDAARTGSLLDEGFDDDYSSHFEQQMAKWGELNLTAHFTAFLRDVGQKAASLALLIHNKVREFVSTTRRLSGSMTTLSRSLHTTHNPGPSFSHPTFFTVVSIDPPHP